MAESLPIQGVNWLLGLFGLKLFVKNKKQRAVNGFLLLYFVYQLMTSLVTETIEQIKEFDFHGALITPSSYASVIAVLVSFVFYKKKIESFILKILDRMTLEDKKSSRRVSFALLILAILNILMHVAVYGCHMNQKKCHDERMSRYPYVPNREPFTTLLNILFYWRMVSDNGYVMAFFPYLMVFYIKYRMTNNRLVALKDEYEQDHNHNKIMDDLEDLRNLHDEFESLFSHIPFFLLQSYFFSLSGYIDWFSGGKNQFGSTAYRTWVTFSVVVELVSLFILILVIDRMQKNIRETGEGFVCRIRYSHDMSIMASMLIDDIRSFISLSVTCWTFCKINKSLILTYSSSIISFSALFIQINQDAKSLWNYMLNFGKEVIVKTGGIFPLVGYERNQTKKKSPLHSRLVKNYDDCLLYFVLWPLMVTREGSSLLGIIMIRSSREKFYWLKHDFWLELTLTLTKTSRSVSGKLRGCFQDASSSLAFRR